MTHTRAQMDDLRRFLSTKGLPDFDSMSQSEKVSFILNSKDVLRTMTMAMRDKPRPQNSNTQETLSELSSQEKLAMYDLTLKQMLEQVRRSTLGLEGSKAPKVPRARTAPVERVQKTQTLSQAQTTVTDTTEGVAQRQAPSLQHKPQERPAQKAQISEAQKRRIALYNYLDAMGETKNIPSVYDPASAPYFDEMIKFITQNEPLEILEKVDDNIPRPAAEPADKTDAEPWIEDESHDGTSCELTFEYDQNGDLVNTGTGSNDQLKRTINTQIIKALESFKLDDTLEEDIANAIAKSLGGNKGFLDSLDDEKITSLDESAPVKPATKAAAKIEPVQPTPTETHEVHEPKMKKKKKKKKKAKKDSVHRGDSSSDWLCEFCEYEKVFGEQPVSLMAWFDKKLEDQERREAYHRQRLRRTKGARHNLSQPTSQLSSPPPEDAAK